MDLIQTLKAILKCAQKANNDYVIITKLGLVRIIKELEKLEAIRQIIKKYNDGCGLEEYMYLDEIEEVLKK